MLRARNEKVVFVTQGEEFAAVGQGRFTIDPACPEDYRRLLREVCGRRHARLRGAIHLWSLDMAEAERRRLDTELIEDQRCGTQSVLYLVRALVTADSTGTESLLGDPRRTVRGCEPARLARSAGAALGHGRK